MTGPMTPYDLVAYPTTSFRQTHPARLGAHGALFGMAVAPPARCRVLDIGGGDGANIIPLALIHPDSEFVSFDLSVEAVRRGQEVVDALCLKNVRLIAADLLQLDLGDEPFDYMIAHGFYSWTPEPVRDGMMALIRRRLAPQGVGFVSYNARPGADTRQTVRGILRFYVDGIPDPVARVAEARRILQEMVDTYPETDPYQVMLKHQCRALLGRPPQVLLHDELGEVYYPAHLHEFVAHAEGHGLQFLTEADPGRCGEGFRPPYALDDAGFDVMRHAQELDFQAMRPFRQTLVVHGEVPLDRRPAPERLAGMFVSCGAARLDGDTFEGPGGRFKVDDERLAGGMAKLAAAWPRSLPVAELVDDDERRMALLRMYWADLLELAPAPSAFQVEVSERPAASPLARLQISRGETRLITLRGTVVTLDDPVSRFFVSLLDGSRTHDEIAEAMAGQVGEPLDAVRAALPDQLKALARMPLLIS